MLSHKVLRHLGATLLIATLVTHPGLATAMPMCPAHKDLPLLTIDELTDSAVPVYDKWQVMWSGVALSDAQVAKLSGDGLLIDRTHDEMEDRGLWVYTGLATAGLGVGVSATGWTMLGRNSATDNVTMGLAIGGILLSVIGVLVMTENIQRRVEPHVAPTPKHRITREEMQIVVKNINNTLYGQICGAILMVGE
jgi:hypothetical protein